ncbi:helix-turn-helix domain-containing protein [Lentzea aerocolonigenes]|uniref:helix-turn-helix domain-containing protein n=1 Tax=Lentzea aerocolonigenes TaxID=68170 RepID=UPI0004C3A9B8|nr:helix-turn-helix transcriptional regulator [Lentzea aerocolonigenes]MCP2242754.1 Helix-turn-helix domain-containing protein [Lentzea aerocolonigenes]
MRTDDTAPYEFTGSFGVQLRNLRKACRMRQIELAVEIPVDHSLVSRWETGAILPSRKDLDRICTVLAVADVSLEGLRYAWRRDRNAAEMDDALVSGRADWVESLRLSVDSVRSLRKSGQPRVALLLGRRDAARHLDAARSLPWHTDNRAVLTVLAELLLEECKAGLDYLPRAEVRAGFLGQALGDQRLVVEAIGGDARLFHTIAAEGVAYVSGDIDKAHLLSRHLLDSRESIPAEWLPEIVRASAINAGRLGDVSALRVAEDTLTWLRAHRADLPSGTHAFVLEGLARGWSGVDLGRAVEVIAEAWEARASAEDSEGASSLRFVQIARSQGEIEVALRSRDNLTDTLAKLGKAIDASRRNQYDKYEAQLAALIGRLNRE